MNNIRARRLDVQMVQEKIPVKKTTMEASTSFQQVPDEVVLDNILSRLDIATRVHFAAVCRSWRDMSRRAPPPIPCLVVPGYYHELLNENSLYLLDPVSPTADHCLLVRRIRDDMVVDMAGCHGPYLIYTPVASPRCRLYSSVPNSIVYNPFSGETLRLPRTGLHPNGSAKLVGYLDRAQLSSNPAISCTSTGTPICLVAAVASNFRSSVCICRLGVHGAMDDDDDQEERYWVASRVLGEDISIHDLIFHGGVLYCICESSTGHCIMAIDLQHLLHDDDDELVMPIWLPAPRLVTVLGNKKHPRDGSLQYYLVVVDSACTGHGELLVATQQYQLCDPSTTWTESPPKFVFRLHKVVEEANSPATSSDPKTGNGTRGSSAALLVEVDDLGDTMLFLGRGCSRPWPWTPELQNYNNNNAKSSETISRFVKKGCIYFVDDELRDSRLGRFCVDGKGFAEFLPDARLRRTPLSFCPPWISLSNS